MANLAFSQKDKNAKLTYFIEKDWRGFLQDGIFKVEQYFEYAELHKKQFGRYWDGFTLEIQYQLDNNFPDGILPKKHSMRSGNRWKAGDKIHFIINNRTKDRFQFAPVLKVKSVQKIEIISFGNKLTYIPSIRILIDDYDLDNREIIELALNDGFKFVEQFFEWFNEDFEGQIVHWTNLKY